MTFGLDRQCKSEICTTETSPLQLDKYDISNLYFYYYYNSKVNLELHPGKTRHLDIHSGIEFKFFYSCLLDLSYIITIGSFVSRNKMFTINTNHIAQSGL